MNTDRPELFHYEITVEKTAQLINSPDDDYEAVVNYTPVYSGNTVVFDDQFYATNEATNRLMVDEKIRIVHMVDVSKTIAWRRRNGKMIDISVKHCSPKEQYIRRVGKILAVQDMLNGAYITIKTPNEGYLQSVSSALYDMFDY